VAVWQKLETVQVEAVLAVVVKAETEHPIAVEQLVVVDEVVVLPTPFIP
jgi:hypothetical protein